MPNSAGKELRSLLDEIRESESNNRHYSIQILDLLDQMKRDHNERLTREEREFVRTLIEQQKEANELKVAIKKKIMTNGAWTVLLGVLMGLWILAKDSISPQ